ncbi:uncharacterized protein [Dysidea avara]|uniref:uncharacterized protein isoform X2 n=1 Tax=Dysidea avara TaxID=196820 RepID=UPI003324EFC0
MASNEEMDQLLSEAKLESSAEMSSDIVSNVFNDVDSSHETSEASALLSKDRSDSTSFVPVELATFPTIDFNAGFEMSTALERCRKTVLNPYHYFLKTIGWRAYRSISHDLDQPISRRILNVFYPVAIFMLLFVSCFTQIITCFRRDWGRYKETNCTQENYTKFNKVFHLTCEHHLFSVFLLPDVLLIGAYLYGIFVFRYKHPEHLSTLMETTFLGYCNKNGRYRPDNLIRSLRILMVVGVLWVVLSLGINVMRVKGLHLLDVNTHIDMLSKLTDNHPKCETSNLTYRWLLVGFTMIGFVLFDLAYIATVMNYVCQCHLLICLVLGLRERVLMKAWAVDEAIKCIKPAQDFLKRLNGHLAAATSLVIFIFITSLVATVFGTLRVNKNHSQDSYAMIVSGLALLQWGSILLLPIYYATRLTKACQKWRQLGHEVRARPYTYQNVKQIDLDSFLNYMSSLKMTAKLLMIPMYPSLVAGTLFLTIVIIVCALNVQTGGEFLASWI